MANQRITKRSPLRMDFFHQIHANAKSLAAFDRLRLRPSRNAMSAGEDVAIKVVELLEQCPHFRLRPVVSGSQQRSVKLKKPDWSDIDVVCMIQADTRNGRDTQIQTFEHFHKIRFAASKLIKEWLDYQFENGQFFAEQSILDNDTPGFVLKLGVKRNSSAHHIWKIDVLFAHELSVNNNAPQWNHVMSQLNLMKQPSMQFSQTSSMAPYRDAFINSLYAKHPQAKPLVRHLKAWNRILMRGIDETQELTVSGFVYEMLVLLLVENGVIPKSFDLPSALATCYFLLAHPERIGILTFPTEKGGGDAMSRPAPPKQHQLEALRRSAGQGLVLVDPMAPFSNVAQRKPKYAEAWRRVDQGAASSYNSLRAQGVSRYEF